MLFSEDAMQFRQFTRFMRLSGGRRLSWLCVLASLLLMNGCHYEEDYSIDYSISVNTSAAMNPTFAGFTTTLYASYVLDDVTLTITRHEWEVISGPGGYALVDQGLEADFTPLAVGNYTLRYRTWYYTKYDLCCSASEYRESFMVVSVGLAPAG
jgi:hypothetical protein